ncbi:hypothetical protein TWF481_004868 [Arthrobotrys musiformis]|uniref:Uncharacterized protein n=1 Tax=Arthrobotrys musiformis TaxID=47236 RepID=A0AAV9WLX1_9PEZI
MPRHAFSLSLRTISRGLGIRYIHLPPRVLPVSMPQTRRRKVLPITPTVFRYANGRTYCDDLSGNSSFSGNWTHDFYDDDVDATTTTRNTVDDGGEKSPTGFWGRLSDYTSSGGYQKPQPRGVEAEEGISSRRSSFSDEDLEMINQTAAHMTSTPNETISTMAKNIPDDVPRIIQKTVGEITKDITFPDPDVWADSSSEPETSVGAYTAEFATSASTARRISTRGASTASGAAKDV